MTIWSNRLLNANKINCPSGAMLFRICTILNLLSLYDNKLQTMHEETFSPLRAIQTMYVYRISGSNLMTRCFHSGFESLVHCKSCVKVFCMCFWKAFGPEPLICDCHLKWLADYLYQPNRNQWCPLHQSATSKQRIGQIKSNSVVQVISYFVWHFPCVTENNS